MINLQQKFELAVATLRVRDRHHSRRKPGWQTETPAEELKKIIGAPKHQRAVTYAHVQRDAEAASKIFFDARCAGKPLHGVNDLRETAAPCIEPRPYLAAT